VHNTGEKQNAGNKNGEGYAPPRMSSITMYTLSLAPPAHAEKSTQLVALTRREYICTKRTYEILVHLQHRRTAHSHAVPKSRRRVRGRIGVRERKTHNHSVGDQPSGPPFPYDALVQRLQNLNLFEHVQLCRLRRAAHTAAAGGLPAAWSWAEGGGASKGQAHDFDGNFAASVLVHA
jgi:hypothetical protein